MSGPKYTLLGQWLGHTRTLIAYWRERGLKDGFAAFRQLKETQHGELKGVDRYGNQYWESAQRVPGRHRWVIYPSRKMVDASAVPPEWHGWLHHMNDSTPIDRPFAPRQFKLAHVPMAMSRQGVAANYLPAGHLLSTRNTGGFGKTGKNADQQLDGTYSAWGQQPNNTNPEEDKKYYPKTERR